MTPLSDRVLPPGDRNDYQGGNDVIYIEGFHINLNVSPVDPDVTGGNNVGWTGNVVSNLAATDNSPLTLRFDGSSEDGDVAAFQGKLDGVIAPGGIYRVWLVAKETGTDLSWDTKPPGMLLFDSNGHPYSIGVPSVFWGPNSAHGTVPAKHLSSTYQQFYILLTMPTPTIGDETPNSIGISVFAPEAQGGGFAPTRTLAIDELIVEPIA